MPSMTSYVWASVLFTLVNSAVAYDVITTTSGSVRGQGIILRTGKRLIKFLGIPYAQAKRFEPPRQPTPWNYTLQVTHFGKICPQPTKIPPLNIKPENISENCLNLNIFVPNTTAFQNKRSSYAVLVMLHGGGFNIGGGFSFDGSILATEGEVIVITINYRLGALGFLSLGEEDLDGNYGLLDVIESLRWIKNNIKRFGGDPNRVTVGGWSAGSRLVGILMLSPLASGLYHNVIMMSGFASGHYSYLEKDEAKQKAWYFAGLLRCPHPSSDFKNCMKRRTIEDYIRAQAKMHPSAIFANWAPVVDGKVLPDSPPKLLEEGRFNKTSILTGVANDDGSGFLGTIPGINTGVDVTHGLTRTRFLHAIAEKTWLRHQDKKVPEIIEFVYSDWSKPDDVNKTRRGYLDLLTDAMYTSPAVQSVNAFAKKEAAVYFYQFEYRSTYDEFGNRVPAWMNVPHGSELQYIFPKPTMNTISGLTKTMVDYWVNFITTGNPSNPFWPKYDIKSQKYMALRSFPTVENQLRPDKMAFWNKFLPKTGKKENIAPKPNPPNPPSDENGVKMALIIVSCLFGVFIIIFIAVVVFFLYRLHNHPAADSSFKKVDNVQPVPSKEQTPSPVQSPYHNQSSLYKNSFSSIEKDPYPPHPYYQTKPSMTIDFVEKRSPTKEPYMESDML